MTILELNGRNLVLRGSLSLNATFLGTLLLVVNANIMFIEKKSFFALPFATKLVPLSLNII